MSLIVTRGFGNQSSIITRGYGIVEVISGLFGEVINLVSRITRQICLISKIKD